MKKICRTLKLMKFASMIDELRLSKTKGNEFIVLFWDNTWSQCVNKNELREYLEQDHKKPIKCVFDCVDRIVIDRDVLIDIDEA